MATSEARTSAEPTVLMGRVRSPAPVTPPRAARSIRRTSSIDTTWPGDRWAEMRLAGRARDVVTIAAGDPPRLLAEDSFTAMLQMDRTIVAIETAPPRSGVAALVGARGGGHLRHALAEHLPGERAAATPLYLLLDDISGASLVAGWAWSQWSDDWLGERGRQFDPEELARMMASKEGVCTGFAPGSSALALGTDRGPTEGTPVPDLRNPADPDGWHALPDQSGAVGMRRARRIDVTLGEGKDAPIRIDAHFQDSGSTPAGPRAGLHEYLLQATADPVTQRLETITAEPHILPFPECPGAIPNLQRLLGTPLPLLREAVLEHLRGIAGCTHLNDAVRALAEAGTLAERLAANLA